ncbi:hypothetical protein GCM10010347_23930 [Streptomyces cirratus]|uniref:Uncharacterized protein n=1 Tax=Streptomyces cirratus TaxID=68187 RepID=A0ABQ3EXK9_9ACTN|nr:hypothetical protein [Streptomyces cirratus]GHB53158.1 hypothetical protein GCM10010347_23930 [Streptomyces cirratus]
MGSSEHEIRRAQGSGPEQPPERWRYARHLAALAAASGEAAATAEAVASCEAVASAEAVEAEAVTVVLRDPDPVMAESAVVTHLDRRAVRLLADGRFPGWARAMEAVLHGRLFPSQRLREWTLLKVIAAGEPWSAAELTAASDWCQRTAAQTVSSHEALGVLAAAARTHRVRDAAARRLRRRMTA